MSSKRENNRSRRPRSKMTSDLKSDEIYNMIKQNNVS